MSKLLKPELDISHLNDVEQVLTYCEFNKTEWLKLGLKLDLSWNTLKAIEADYKIVDRCLLECLSKWLLKADNVTTPTGKTLVKALRNINETSVAENILKIMTDPASCLLLSLNLSIDDDVIIQIQSNEIITQKTATDMKRYGVIALCTTVADDHDKLRLIGEILSRNDDTKSIGENLLEEYDKIFPCDPVTKSQYIDACESTCKTSQNQEQSANSQTVESTDDNLTVEVTKKSAIVSEKDKGLISIRKTITEQTSIECELTPGDCNAKSLQPKKFYLNVPYKIRSYQKELACSGLERKNYIICAPTGSGKTLIAALIIYDHLTNKKQRGKVLFVVQKQQLAHQQTGKLQEYLKGAQIVEISGETEITIYTTLLQVDIIVCTSGKLANELENEQFNISECSLLILDECHHAIGVDPYAITMEHYLLKKFEFLPIPQVVGMTASPGAGRGKYLSVDRALAHQVKLCARLDATYGIKCVQDNLDELNECVPKPSHESHTLPQRNPNEPFVTILTNAMTMLEGMLISMMLPISSLSNFDRCSSAYQQWIKMEIEAAKLSGIEDQRDQISILELLEEYYIALITYDDFEIENAQKVIKEVPLKADTLLNDTEKKLKDLHIKTMIDLLGIKSQPNPLLQKAEELLYHHFSKKSESKALFFVRDIRHTDYVTEWIKSRERLSKLVRPCSISGYARQKSMTKEEQVTVVDNFRSGVFNLLATTSVLEEGLDVPECNMVIRFQILSNEVANVQAQGRARAEDSTMHTIITSDSHAHHNLLINIEKKELAVQAVRLLSSDLGDNEMDLHSLQNDILLKRKERLTAQSQRWKTWDPKVVNLLCSKCGVIACKASDVCKFGEKESPHFVVVSLSFVSDKMDKINRTEKPEPAAIRDFSRPFKIACKKCHEEWGIWGCWKNSGVQLPVLKCKSFTFHNTKIDQRESGKQWKKAPFEILFYDDYKDQDDY